ncbi:MAG: hypothetical protein WKF73_09895 [Nocardioidaceae bacterium]
MSAVDVGEPEEAADAVHHRGDRGVHQPGLAELADVQLDVGSLDPDQRVQAVGLAPGEPAPQLVGVQRVGVPGVAGQGGHRSQVGLQPDRPPPTTVARGLAARPLRPDSSRSSTSGPRQRDPLSSPSHLRSRREVEGLLGRAGTPVTVLRAGIIVGSGGISWEMTRQLVDHLPAMVTPRWVRTRTQPIAVADVVRYLVEVLDDERCKGRVFELGGPEVLQYVTMLRRVAKIKKRRLLIVPVPLLTPGLSSRWLALVTDVDTQTGRSLVDSMANEVVVTDHSIRSLVPFELTGYDEAVRTALREYDQQKTPR